MAGKNKDSLLDDNFLEDEETEHSFHDDRFGEEFEHSAIDVSDSSLPEPKDKSGDGKKKAEFEIEVASDTPDKDKGRWVADDKRDGEPDFPNEDEIKQYSKDVQARISKMTARTHAERRRADDIQRQLAEAEKFAKELLQRNNQLSELIESGEKVLVSEHKSRLDSQLAAAKIAYREAHEAGDTNGMIAAQEAIAKSAAAIDRLSVHRPQPMPRVEESALQQVFRTQAQPQVDETAKQWQEQNSWFGKDTVMTAFAMGVHTELVKNRGISPADQAYWTTLNSEMKKRFPDRLGQDRQSNQPRRTETIVGTAARTGQNTTPKKVTLTESQVKLANRLGLTVEQYARQVYLEQNKD